MAIIPDKNPQALISYYLGLLTILPLYGIVFVVPAVFLGIRGIIAEKQNPEIEGAGHAWFGTIMGCLFGLIYFIVFAFMVLGMLMSRR